MKTKRIAVSIGISFGVLAIGLIVFFSYKTSINRPQEPSKPYPYYTEEVTFENIQAHVTLAGTLTLPSAAGNYPAVILISGSGAQNRDEEISGHKPFLIIADHLTKHGIAVLRYDDRGVAKSTGNFKAATTADFASDVASAVEFLKTRVEIDRDKIGLIGHSEGGLIAPMVASNSKDVSFIVLLAGPGIEIMKVLLMQQESISRADGISESDIKEFILPVHKKAYRMISMSTDGRILKTDLARLIEETYDSTPTNLISSNMTREQVVSTQSDKWSSEWFRNFLKYDPASILEKVTCPVLALNGEKDLVVTAKENLSGISNALTKGGNTNMTVKELPNLNHLFQNCETGSPAEYAKIEETFSPIALKEMADWILKQVE
ncbi:alpha-beta hydrolase superfamily lysophospholipase [Algoriphagus sp. 4150]|uniref:alpha/beta hydrolase family protein n=1 Tax=Algoriphagus sp. 4150 TaxID=2817756 RepID=UPI002858D45E|nr:alpha/beta fold hydrolase [Algoriphagus sp. 4150]MDR7128029.1 alpha-beta hydrolase superfamily lysophospholipase [Algoriphagus sp. 4150]